MGTVAAAKPHFLTLAVVTALTPEFQTMQRSRIARALGILVAACAIAPAPSALARELLAEPQANATARVAYTPHTLVQAAYNGRLDGIPGFARLQRAAALGDIRAEDVIQAAIARGRLTDAQLDDRGFRNAVDANLRGLNQGI